MNETTVTVIGNIASEVTARRVGGGNEELVVVGFRVASSERRWDRVSGAWVDGDRFSAWVTCWRRLGEHVRSSMVKGDPVVVTGRLSVREYESGGERRFSTEISATAVGPNLSRCTAQITRQKPSAVDPERAEALAHAAGQAGPVPAEIGGDVRVPGGTGFAGFGSDESGGSFADGPVPPLNGIAPLAVDRDADEAVDGAAERSSEQHVDEHADEHAVVVAMA